MFEKFGKSLDRITHEVAIETDTTRVEPKTDSISAPYPDGDSPQLRLEISVGTVELSAGNDKLIDGSVTYNIAEWTPRVLVEEQRVTVKQDVGLHMRGAWHNARNEWKLALGTTKPFSLSIAKGAGESRLSLGGVPLKDVQIEVGAGKAQISFDKPNPADCSQFNVNMGAGSLAVDGLLNTNAERFGFAGGAGEITLNFTGESLNRFMTVNISTGAGKIVLNVKKGVAFQATVKKFIGSVHTQGDFHAVQTGVYETSAFAAGSPTFKVQINTPVADIVFNEVG